MRTLRFYYASSFVRSFFGALGILALLSFAVEMMIHLDSLLDADRGFAAALRRLLARSLASHLIYLPPMAAGVGAFVAVAVAAGRREMLALRSVGVPPLQALSPILLLGALIAVLTFTLAETLGVDAAGYRAGSGTTAGPEGGRVEIHGGGIWHRTGQVIYNGRGPGPEGVGIRDVRVFEMDERGGLLRTVRAGEAQRISPEQWHFKDAVLHSFDPRDKNAAPRVQRAAQLTLDLRSERGLRLDSLELRALPLLELRRYARSLEQAGADAGGALALLSGRIALPLVSLVLILFFLAFGLDAEHSGALSRSILKSILAASALLVLAEYSEALAGEMGGDFAPLLPFTVPAVFGALGLFLLWRAAR